MPDNRKEPTAEQIIKDIALAAPINLVNGKCSRCGQCCPNHLKILPSEIDRIKKYIEDNNVTPCHHNDVPDNVQAEVVADFSCPFLDTTGAVNKCLIYDVRPWICEFYTCAINHDEKAYNEAFEKSLNSGKVDPMEVMNSNMREDNVGQLFFPDEYLPKQSDLVVINEVYPKECHYDYQGEAFIFTGQTRTIGDTTKAFIMNPKRKIWFDIRGLTKLEKPAKK